MKNLFDKIVDEGRVSKLSLDELKMLNKMFSDGVKDVRLVNEIDGYVLLSPQHSMDMNYHLIELETNNDYLIDIDVISDDEMDDYDEFLITWNELKNLDDILLIKDVSWTVVKNKIIL